MASHILSVLFMNFPTRLAQLRKAQGLTQQMMADKIGIHVSQLKKYEAGSSQPTLEVFRKIAVSLNVSADALLFDEAERGPSDEFRLKFEAVAKLDDDEKEALTKVIDSMLHMHDAKRWIQQSTPTTKKAS